jgi:hypothetical protein
LNRDELEKHLKNAEKRGFTDNFSRELKLLSEARNWEPSLRKAMKERNLQVLENLVLRGMNLQLDEPEQKLLEEARDTIKTEKAKVELSHTDNITQSASPAIETQSSGASLNRQLSVESAQVPTDQVATQITDFMDPSSQDMTHTTSTPLPTGASSDKLALSRWLQAHLTNSTAVVLPAEIAREVSDVISAINQVHDYRGDSNLQVV